MAREFIWRGNPLPTIGELLDAAIAAADSGDALDFMASYRACNEHADANIGYIIGYVEPRERRERLWSLLGVKHPIFGGR